MKICELFEQPTNANFICGHCKTSLGSIDEIPDGHGTILRCARCFKFEMYVDYDIKGILKGLILSYANYELCFIRGDSYFKVYEMPLGSYLDDPPSFVVPIAALECNINYFEINDEIIKLLAAYS